MAVGAIYFILHCGQCNIYTVRIITFHIALAAALVAPLIILHRVVHMCRRIYTSKNFSNPLRAELHEIMGKA